MVPLSLVVCLHKEKDLLERLLVHSKGCYDDLVVVHDGQDEDDVRGLVTSYKGLFFERQRAYQQEIHWPFAWEKANHDWILRLDADEFPSESLRRWIETFRAGPKPPIDLSAYTCIWPLWDGKRAKTSRWPDFRIFLFNRNQVRFIGIGDQSPIPDNRIKHVELVLHHEPKLPSYGVRYTLFREKSRRWRKNIATALTGKPTNLPCWRWDSDQWPPQWESIRREPLATAFRRLLYYSPIRNAKAMLRKGEIPYPTFLATAALQHFMTCLAYVKVKRELEKKKN